MAHWSTMQRLLSGPTQIHEDAFLWEIPDNATHEQRVAYYDLAIRGLEARFGASRQTWVQRILGRPATPAGGSINAGLPRPDVTAGGAG